MDASAHGHPDLRDQGQTRRQSRGAKGKQSDQSLLSTLKEDVSPLMAWWTKVNNDWVFNLSGLLAYNFLMSTIPILLVLLAVAGFILGSLAPGQLASFQSQLGSALPGGSNLMIAVTRQLSHSAGVLLIVGIVTAAFTGSRLFIVIENCFSIIFRLRGRDFIHQNLMALGMLFLYVILVPLISLGGVIPQAINEVLGLHHNNPVGAFFINVIGILVSVVFAYIFFAAVYIVVPNRPVRLSEVWKGTLVAAVLLVLYNILFPLYEGYVLHPGNYGSVAGFAIVILVFFYYLGFILLIGAEVNSWASGQRQTEGDISAILHEVQAHDTTRGAAGPTAGLPQEDLEHGKGADATRDTPQAIDHERADHRADVKPPRPAEAHMPGPPYRTPPQREERWQEADREVKAGEVSTDS
jgi:YihY family inner membrane protein